MKIKPEPYGLTIGKDGLLVKDKSTIKALENGNFGIVFTCKPSIYAQSMEVPLSLDGAEKLIVNIQKSIDEVRKAIAE